MNKNIKIILISICVLLAILILFGALYIIRTNRVLADEDKQVEVLCQMFEYFLKNYDDYNIVIDESTLKNFTTNEKFSDENIAKLKKYEKNTSDESGNYTLSISVDPYISHIVLSLKYNSSNVRRYQQHFYITPGLTKITFKPDKALTVSN